ncbi:response regulator transcription factor [Pedobacter africanus]|uniref:DNA-binding response regulator, OmpR family, contains REC and winged-helix (WHTH) domain n=1 Tax=Pedobacter africanus TaxID=151894 RepID=A0A1W2DYM2_9SPHI|nr:response regulator transcription factor [Pedobacter africanus]SMD01928.1 DNA-binding response regulator, OmpR family, contains REC and winged-helix (wHTH) domain [Pedobacter africanus]
MFKIGLAEDDLKIGSLVKTGLEESGYEVVHFTDGRQLLENFDSTGFNLLILDIMMPGIDGITLCRQLRQVQQNLPILMLTALGNVDDKVTGLNAGADDYLAKPFHFKELLARIEALLRRYAVTPEKKEHELVFEDISLNTYSKEVKRAGIHIALTAKEYTLLELFLRNPNRLLSRQYIAEHAWDITFDTGTNVIDVYVNFLRNKIEKGFSRKVIHTKINMGYILK